MTAYTVTPLVVLAVFSHLGHSIAVVYNSISTTHFATFVYLFKRHTTKTKGSCNYAPPYSTKNFLNPSSDKSYSRK